MHGNRSGSHDPAAAGGWRQHMLRSHFIVFQRTPQ
jgi:hypothetical protein